MSTFAPVPSLIQPEQFNAMQPWPKRTTSLPTHGDNAKLNGLKYSKHMEKCRTVAISGCSSSGKTTLAILLAEIFSTSEDSDIDNPKVTLNDSATCLIQKASNHLTDDPNHNSDTGDEETSLLEKESSIIIHQDAYFLPKSFCPLITFKSTTADIDFVQRSLTNDNVGIYIMSCSGSLTHNQQVGLSHPTAAPAEGYKPVPPMWKITGPDADRWEAIDALALLSTIKYVRECGILPLSSLERVKEMEINFPGLLVTKSERDEIVTQNVTLIAEMKDLVKSRTKRQAITSAKPLVEGLHVKGKIEVGIEEEVMRPKLAFVEGFLLFPCPPMPTIPNISTANVPSVANSNKENRPPSAPENELGNKLETPEEKHVFQIAETQADAFQEINKKAKEKLMGEFDIKLFLPTSKNQAKARRLIRDCYIDAPAGSRVPGQMWRTDGYFEDVVWENFVREHEWIFGDGAVEGHAVEDEALESADMDSGIERGGVAREAIPSVRASQSGVHVRPTVDAGVEGTVRWAVGIILEELGKNVSHGRPPSELQDFNGHEYEEGDYEDDEEVNLIRGEESAMGKKEKKNMLRGKIMRFKRRVVKLFGGNKKNRDGENGKVGFKRQFSFSLGRINEKVKEEENGSPQNGDVGRKTVLESGLIDRGFWSPKP